MTSSVLPVRHGREDGEGLYTPPNKPHFGRNATDHISRTLVVRIKDMNKPISVEVKP